MNVDALKLDAEEAEDDDREVNWDNNSSTLNEEDAEERKQNWNDALVGKVAKAERKIAKNQIRFDVITKEDLENIQIALHPVDTIDLANEAAQAPNGQGLIDNRYVVERCSLPFYTVCVSYVYTMYPRRTLRVWRYLDIQRLTTTGSRRSFLFISTCFPAYDLSAKSDPANIVPY